MLNFLNISEAISSDTGLYRCVASIEIPESTTVMTSDSSIVVSFTGKCFRSVLCMYLLSVVFSPAPTGAPDGLTSSSVESRSLTVQWGIVPCPDQRGPITEYRLHYSNGTSVVDTTGEGIRQHVLTGLTPFTSYTVQVAAVNAGGTGPYSTALTVETLQDSE